ncbi:MAG: DUF2281 domain-containing protein [Pseudomonadota bacterium]
MAKSSSQMRTLLDKLDQLPPEQQVEVENFVDFLANKQRRRAALDRLLSIAPALEAAGVQPISDDEVVALVKEARAERRQKDSR